jgi:hypothetical protein
MGFRPEASDFFVPAAKASIHQSPMGEFMAQHGARIASPKLFPGSQVQRVACPLGAAARWRIGCPLEGPGLGMEEYPPRPRGPSTMGHRRGKGRSQNLFDRRLRPDIPLESRWREGRRGCEKQQH